MAAERWSERGDREDAGGYRHGDREHVVDEQSGRSDEARQGAEILLRDDVGAAARLVDADRLSVRDDDDREQRRDSDRDGENQVDRRGGGGDEDDHRGLGRVGDRRQRVRGEDRKREGLREQCLLELPRGHRPADNRPLQRTRRRPLERRVFHAARRVAIITGHGASWRTDHTSCEKGRRERRVEATVAPMTIKEAWVSRATSATARPISPGRARTI